MPTKSVAIRLQNATDAEECLLISPYLPEAMSLDAHGDRIEHFPRFMAGEWFVGQRMAVVTIDGVRTSRHNPASTNFGYYLFSEKVDDYCEPDAEGYCYCDPTKYRPLTQRAGKICETCWMKHEVVVGIGKDCCPHN